MDFLLLQRSNALSRRYRAERNSMRMARSHIRNTADPFGMTDELFKSTFRFNKEICRTLIDEIKPFLNLRLRINSIKAEIRILCVLRCLATGSYQRPVGCDSLIGCSQSVVSRCIAEVCEVIEKKLAPKYIKFPTLAEQEQTKIRFFMKYGFPGIVGLIDCTHISIKRPPISVEHVYYAYRKSAHTKNVQIVCDDNLKILNVNSTFGGTAHDSYVYGNSRLKSLFKHEYTHGRRDFYLLGDSGYPLEPWLMTPVSSPTTEAENRYNGSHKSTRNGIERCIGVLKSRFRCLCKQRVLMYSPQKAGMIINACATLHNILICNNYIDEVEVEDEDIDAEGNANDTDERNLLNEGRRTRDRIINTYFS